MKYLDINIISTTININYHEQKMKGYKNWVSLPKTRDLLGGTVKNAGRLLWMLPMVFREFC